MVRVRSVLRHLLPPHASGGAVLVVAAAAALLIANSPLAPAYRALLATSLGPLSVLHWINDALMALFFLLVGLEIKRELVDGRLARWSDRALPALAAVGGMVAPALVYLVMVRGMPGLARGWAIPAATDIAFAVAVLALLGRRVPAALTLFLTTVAIIDDMGAVAIIALVYTASISLPALAAAAAIWASMLLACRRRIGSLPLYGALGAALWLAVWLSGVHATVAGVLAALAIPLRPGPGRPADATSPLHRLEHGLAPWVMYAVMPLFAFANAGLSFAGMTGATLVGPPATAIALGLFLGKQAGVFGAVRLAVALGLARRPHGTSWSQLYGVALLAGIGFTMSLFIGNLAFPDSNRDEAVKLGVIGGSLMSALAGYAVLRVAGRRSGPADDPIASDRAL